MKTLLVFRGPPHHQQLLRPVEDELESRGWKIVRYTANTEAVFQAPLNVELGTDGYLWLPDFDDPKKSEAVYERHWEWFRELYEQKTPISLLPPQILDRVMHFTCEEFISTRRMIDQVQPTACLALHEINRWGMMLAYWASVRRVPVWTMQEGMYYGHPWIYTGHTRYSRSLVWGEAARQKLLEAGSGEERVHVVGHPDLARRYRQGTESKAQLKEELPADVRDRPKLALVFVTNVAVRGAGEDLFTGWEEQEEWGMVVRCHQLSTLSHMQTIEKVFRRKGIFFSPLSIPYEHHWRLMANADLCLIVGCTTTALEWLYQRTKPLAQIGTLAMYQNFAEAGLAIEITGMPLLTGFKKTEAEWAATCQPNVEQFVSAQIAEGEAFKRLADIIEGSAK